MKRIVLPICLLAIAVAFTDCKKDISYSTQPEIVSDSVWVTANQAVFRWKVDFPGKVSSVVYVGTMDNMSDAVPYGSEEASETKEFEVTVTGLMENCTYYYLYKVWNPSSSYDMGVKSFLTPHLTWPRVLTLSAAVDSKLVVTVECQVVDYGGGNYLNTGICWSTHQNPTLDDNHKEVDPNYPDPYTVTLENLTLDSVYYVRAYATNEKGTSYGNEIIFIYTQPAPEGAINGLFSITPVKKAFFSQGNLQYQASTNSWRFAEQQWETIGDGNANIASNYSGWIDLFGWGTSGWNNGNTYYHPWDYQAAESDYPLYGPVGQQHLTFNYASADWGVYNGISNGGNQAGLWRTLSQLEWNYLLVVRNASSINGVENARFTKAVVNGVKGLIIFPDRYIHPSDIVLPQAINNDTSPEGWNLNNYSKDDWGKLQNSGAVFLPAEGYRKNKTVYTNPLKGGYWSTTNINDIGSWAFQFAADQMLFDQSYYFYRAVGECVRLIQEKQ